MISASERLDNVRMIRDSAAALADETDFSRIRGLRFSELGFERSAWSLIAEMGWLGLPLPESDGGAGLGMTEYCAMTCALGRALTPEPLIEGVLAARLLEGDVRRSQLAGELIVLPVWAPKDSARYAEGKLNGRARLAAMAMAADAYVVVMEDGVALVQRSSPGVTVESALTQDGGHLGALSFSDAPASLLQASSQIAVAEAGLATAAYLLGAMERAFEISLDYLRTRRQFAKPIGAFQALQHRAADLKLQIALTRASIDSAAEAWDNQAPEPEVLAAVSRAKARAGEAAMRVTRETIQLHGAIGYTDEADISLFVRKAMTLANRYGSAAEQRALRVAELQTAQEASA